MTTLLEIVTFAMAVAAFLGTADRLRCITWRTTRPYVVLFYLAAALWALFVALDASTSATELYQLLGMVVVLAALWGSRHRWRNGPPPGVTRPAPLGPPEISRSR